MDVPTIARHTGAVVHGSASTTAVCRGAGLNAKQIHEFIPREPFAYGAFRVTFIPSEHGKAFFGRVPYPGDIEGEPRAPYKTKQLKSGPTSMMLIEAGNLRMLHAGSAALVDEELALIGPVQVLMPGLAGRKGTPDFLCRMTAPIQPRVIIGHHFDNFFLPWSKGMKFNHGVNLQGFIEDAKQACPDARILLPTFFDTMAFDAESGELLD
jgi:L-ascorbate metabolism protein UlaG (beta-lactamase superfamily)